MNDRVEMVKTVFAGIKELILATAALATIWIQAQNSGKLDVAAAKTQVVESKLEATTATQTAKLEHIATAADASKSASVASALQWKAWKSRDPDDMNEADAAIAAAEKAPK